MTFKPNLISQTTLKDIAEALGISISTVSRALKNNPRISNKTKAAVKKVALELGYNSIYLNDFHKKKQSNLIGVIVPKISYHLYAMAISGIESVAEKHGMHIIVCQSNESYMREKSLVLELINVGVSGLIVSLASETKDFLHFEKLSEHGIPLVFFNRKCNELEAHKVTIDNRQAAHEAVNHLINIGCKKIAYLGGPEVLQINQDRIQGYYDALNSAGIKKDKNLVVYSKFDKESTFTAARKLLYSPNYPDGILTFSDQIAISVMLTAKERGIVMPEQLSVIGFNNEPVSELLEPSLTSINQPGFEMGKQATKLLLQSVEDPVHPHEKKILKSVLVIRNSTNKNKTI